MIFGLVLRMPLHPNCKGGVVGESDTFDHPVFGNRLEHKVVGEAVDTLAVQRIDHQLRFTR